MTRLLNLGLLSALALMPRPSPPAEGPAHAVRFAVIGDSGSGTNAQYALADELAKSRERAPFEFVLMLGDNLYGSERPRDYEKKFERPYLALLDAGVKFYAALGNHDSETQRLYPGFNMNGRRYYSFSAGPDVEFFALDSTLMDRAQLDWIDSALGQSRAGWKICFLHHPLYSSGRRHGSDLSLRAALEPLLIRHGVAVVFAGHDHLYERIVPQHGIAYFVSGAAGKLRRGNRPSPITAKMYDADLHFMLAEITGDVLRFEAVNRSGEIIDSGSISRPPVPEGSPLSSGRLLRQTFVD